MVRKIKKKAPARPAPAAQAQTRTWYVPFDAEGHAAVFIHQHGETGDHGACGPVVMCCERAQRPYAALAPDLCAHIAQGHYQQAEHLTSWLDNGVGAIYFVLCDPNDAEAVYQFGLPADRARHVLTGRTPLDPFRRPDLRFKAEPA
jgi:hypothetical protein